MQVNKNKENNMKNITLSVLVMMAIGNISYAGGDIAPVVEPEVTVPAINESVSESGFYVGLGVSAVSTRESGLDFFSEKEGQDRTGDITLLAGYDFNQYIAVEGRYMVSVTEEDILERSSWGIYVKPQYPIYEDFKVYALLGYGGFDADGIDGSTVNVDETSFQWGIGASYEVMDNISIFVDYLNIANDVETTTFITSPSDVDSDAITVGMTYKF